MPAVVLRYCTFQGACMPAPSLHLCLTLCDPMNCSPPGSSVHGILQVRILEWVAMPASRGSSQLRDRTWVSCIEGGFLSTELLGKPHISWYYTVKIKSVLFIFCACFLCNICVKCIIKLLQYSTIQPIVLDGGLS